MRQAVIYSQPGCTRCAQAKHVLETLGYSLEEEDADELIRGDFNDPEALAELHMNDGELPVVVVDGRAVREGDELYSLIKEHKEW